MDKEEIKEMIRDSIEEVFFSDDEFSPFNSLQDKINQILNVQRAEERLDVAIKYSDKLEDYMKNGERLNQMINEFKGLVAIVRGEAKAVKDQNENLKKLSRKILQVLEELHK